MKDTTKVMAEFSIEGQDIDVDFITKELKIKPNISFNRNDLNIDKPISKKQGCWWLETKYEESIDINIQLNKIIKKLKPKITELYTIKNKYHCCITFGIVIEIHKEEKPAIYLEQDTIKFMSEIGADFGVDYYIY